MSEIELILTKLKIVSEEKENGMYLCDKEHSKILLDYIQQKENIIKEVREKIENTQFAFDFEREINTLAFDLTFTKEGRELLEILDKEKE